MFCLLYSVVNVVSFMYIVSGPTPSIGPPSPSGKIVVGGGGDSSSVSNWPNVRLHNSKGAEQKSERRDKSAAELGTNFARKGQKGPNLKKNFVTFTFPLGMTSKTGVFTDWTLK